MKKLLLPSLMILLLSFVSACGQKGALYHPSDEQKQEAAEKKKDQP